ncbi:MAG: surface-adhesin E family protein [Betaproteobacteria bacterium]|jgi:hypothetical protein
MFKLGQLLIGLMLSGPLWAGWTLLAESENLTVYVDFSSPKKMGNIASGNMMLDFPHLQFIEGRPYRSALKLINVDCVEEKIRTASTSLYASQMGAGQQLRSLPSAGWQYITAGTIESVLFNSLCH